MLPPSEIIRTFKHCSLLSEPVRAELRRAALTDLGVVCFDIHHWVVSMCQASVCSLRTTVCFTWLQTSEPKNKKYTQDKQAKKRTEGQGDCYKRPTVMRFPMLCKVCKKLSNLYNTVPSLSIHLINEICKIIKLAYMCCRKKKKSQCNAH